MKYEFCQGLILSEFVTDWTFSLLLSHEIIYFLQLAGIILARLVTNSCQCCAINSVLRAHERKLCEIQVFLTILKISSFQCRQNHYFHTSSCIQCIILIFPFWKFYFILAITVHFLNKLKAQCLRIDVIDSLLTVTEKRLLLVWV